MLDKEEISPRTELPLIVNTPGWVKGELFLYHFFLILKFLLNLAFSIFALDQSMFLVYDGTYCLMSVLFLHFRCWL